MREPSLRVAVDRELCVGFGLCVETVPAMFHLDDEGKSVVQDFDVDPSAAAEAVAGCPRDAIAVLSRESVDRSLASTA